MSYGAAIAAGIGALGSIGGAGLTAASSAHSARQVMVFNERMSNTANQRAVADMKAAGLNPMLAYTEGPASSPQGVMPQPPDYSGVVSSAQNAIRLRKDIEVADAGIAKTVADAKQAGMQTLKTGSDMDVNRAVIDQLNADRKLKDTTSALSASQLPRARNLQEVESGWFGKLMSYVDRLGSAVGLGTKLSMPPK